jgi:putative resolvase
LGSFRSWGRKRGLSRLRGGKMGLRARPQARQVLKDATVGRIVVEHRDRLARFGFELVEAALYASGKRIVVVEEGEVKDDLVRDLLKVLTSACERPMKRSARDRAKRILESICG